MSATTAIRPPTGPAAQPEPPERIRVMVADPDGLARRSIHNALQHTDAILTLPAATDPQQTLELTRYYNPTILILDTTLTHPHNPDLIAQLLDATPHTRIITISADPDPDPAALAALTAGAIGHIDKNIDPNQLARLITLAAHGQAIIPRHLTIQLLDLLHSTPTTGWRPTHSRLTTREWEIVELLDQHTSTQQIAQTLVVSPTTVYSHIKSVLRKLGVHTRHDAVTAAHQLRHQEVENKNPHPNPINPP
jgi:DNA-binding NarL/FixJ family response regulator